MVKAYSLISVAPGRSVEVFKKVKAIDHVKSAEAVAGPYDIVARIEVDSLEKLSKVVFAGIRTVPGVVNTTSLIVLEL